MDIRNIMPVTGILHRLLWYLSLYFNGTVPCSFFLSLQSWKTKFLKELLTIILPCLSCITAAFICSPLSSHGDKSCLVEMSSHTVSIWFSFKERLSPSKQFFAFFQWFLCSFSQFYTVWQESYCKCQRAFQGRFHPRQHIWKIFFATTNVLKYSFWSGQKL